MLDDRNFRAYEENAHHSPSTGFDTDTCAVERKKTFPYLDGEGLKRWCLEGYEHPITGKRTYGKDVLLSAFYGKRGFWIELFEYADSLDEDALGAMGGRLPPDRWSFAYRIKKAGYGRISPKNVCVWLGALDAERSEIVDDIGNLTRVGLMEWCHTGYETGEGKRAYWKNVLSAAAESWDFWNELQSYADRLPEKYVRNLWGRVPRFPRMYAERLLGEDAQSITVATLFEKLSVPLPKPERIRQSSKWYLSATELKSWCRTWYRDPRTGERKYGKDALLDALYSWTFWSSFDRYVKNLSKLEIAEMRWLIPSTQSGYDERVADAWYEPGAKGTCLWLWALDDETSRLSDDAGFLNAEGLSRWYWEGYLSDEGKTVLGRDVVAWCLKSGSFWKSLERYAEGLSDEERRNMAGRFPKHAKSIGERTVGREASIDELTSWLESSGTRPNAADTPNSSTESAFDWPRVRVFPESMSKEARWRVRSFVRKALELAAPECAAPMERSPFRVRETASEISVSCSSRRLMAKLEQYRGYVDDALSAEASAWLEKPIGFDWKDSKKTGAKRNTG